MSERGGDTVKCFVIHYTTPLFPGRSGLGWHRVSQSRLFCLASGFSFQQGALCVCSGVLAELLPPSIAQDRGRQTPMISNNSYTVLIRVLCSANGLVKKWHRYNMEKKHTSAPSQIHSLEAAEGRYYLRKLYTISSQPTSCPGKIQLKPLKKILTLPAGSTVLQRQKDQSPSSCCSSGFC